MAAADVFHALGFMQMLDIYGEMPTHRPQGNPSPVLMVDHLQWMYGQTE